MSHRDLKFRVAFHVAFADTREAPWYGVWNWVLTKVIFKKLCSDSGGKQTTVTYPQYPLTHDIDTCEDDPPSQPSVFGDDDVFTSIDGDPMDEDLQGSETSTPPVYRGRQSGAPSPPDWIHRTADIDIMGYSPEAPSTPTHPRHSSSSASPSERIRRHHMPSPVPLDHPSPDSAMVVSPSLPRKTKRSTRIPDFAELLHDYDGNAVRKHLLLLVENKKRPIASIEGSHVQQVNFLPVLEQTEEQAAHAFRSRDNTNVTTIGVIVALGHYWRYLEYHRHIIISTTRSQHRSHSESTYIEEEPSVSQVYSELDSVKEYYDEILKCCVLGDSHSDDALFAVRERMKELVAQYQSAVELSVDGGYAQRHTGTEVDL